MSRSSSMHPFAVRSGTVFPLKSIDSKSLPSDLLQRAKMVDRQMKYFGLVARKCSFAELLPSAHRAGFALLNQYDEEREACFRWAVGEPDFIFSVSYKDPDKVSVVAEAREDISGLVLVGHSHVADISVEMKPWMGCDECGTNALRILEILLSFPGFVATPSWANY